MDQWRSSCGEGPNEPLRGLGDAMLRWAERHTAEHGRVRETRYGTEQERLQKWYAERGYQLVGIRAFV